MLLAFVKRPLVNIGIIVGEMRERTGSQLPRLTSTHMAGKQRQGLARIGHHLEVQTSIGNVDHKCGLVVHPGSEMPSQMSRQGD